MNFLSRLKLWQKLAALVVAMAIPSVLLGIFYLGGANSQVALAKDELEGAKYVQALGGLLAEAANHRSRLFAVLTGDAAGKDQVSASESEMQRHIEEVDTTDSQVGARFKVSESWSSIKSDWDRLKNEGGKLSPDEAVARHNVLLDHIQKLRDRLCPLRYDSGSLAGDCGVGSDRHPQRAGCIDCLG